MTQGSSNVPITSAQVEAIDHASDLLLAWKACPGEVRLAHLDLFHAFGRKAISLGQPIQAYDLLEEGLLSWPDDIELKYLSALALCRAGSTSSAIQRITSMRLSVSKDNPLFIEILSLCGRIAKDCWDRMEPGPKRDEQGEIAIRSYFEAYDLSGEVFPLINAATMCLLTGKEARAEELAIIAKKLLSEGSLDGYWDKASLGEVSLLLGDMVAAKKWYHAAVAQAGSAIGDLASMRLQAKRLSRVIAVPESVSEELAGGQVVVCVGHMLDQAGRSDERFPARLESPVKNAIEQWLEAENANFGYVSPANGTDIIFAECMLARGAEVHIILPFRSADFLETSVAHGGASWIKRFEYVLDHATTVTHATREGYLGHDSLFQYSADFLCGTALLRSDRLGVPVTMLAVLDRTVEGGEGGTHMALESWGNRPSAVIDLALLRDNNPATAADVLPAPHTPRVLLRSEQRSVRTMLFADVKGFSKLSEDQLPAFFSNVLGLMAKVLDEYEVEPELRNTWGDALFLVFKRVSEAARFALALRDAFQQENWTVFGLPRELSIRISLHAGPVFPYRDPIINKINYYGEHVNNAARIEPVTAPGQVYTSEAVAALLRLSKQDEYVCDYKGRIILPKDYGQAALYQLRQLGDI